MNLEKLQGKMISHAVILCGGSGTRMTKAGYTQPKFLLPVGDKSIGFLMLKNLKNCGIESVHLLLGEGAEQIKDKIPSFGRELDLRITFTQELEPKGTGGAILDALEDIPDEFLLLHGDLLINTDLNEIVRVFLTPGIDFAQVVHPSSHIYDSDLVEVDSKNKIIKYCSKPHADNMVVRNLGNAGIYALRKSIFEGFPKQTKMDLDRDLLPLLISKGFTAKAIRNRGFVRDLGTPERYEKTVSNLENFSRADKARAAVFLDRDGTINQLRGFIRNESEIVLIEGAGEAISKLNKAGFLVIVTTNQPVVARGEVSLEMLNKIHSRLEMEIAEFGAYFDEIYYCPHHPDSGYEGEVPELKIDCDCRKPKPGLVEKACEDFVIDMEKSWVIGDSWRDLELGKNASINSLRVGSGEEFGTASDFESLLAAVDYILKYDVK